MSSTAFFCGYDKILYIEKHNLLNEPIPNMHGWFRTSPESYEDIMFYCDNGIIITIVTINYPRPPITALYRYPPSTNWINHTESIAKGLYQYHYAECRNVDHYYDEKAKLHYFPTISMEIPKPLPIGQKVIPKQSEPIVYIPVAKMMNPILANSITDDFASNLDFCF